MPRLIVTYPRHEGCHFDRDYYLDTHMGVVDAAWGAMGMTGAEVMWPVDDAQPFACMIAIDFPDQASIDASLGCAATPGVLADVARFTDIQPLVYRTA